MTDLELIHDDSLLTELGPGGASPAGTDLSLVLDVPVELAVEIGRTTMTIRQAMALAPGSVVVLDRMAGEPVDLLVNGKRIARGEVVAIDEEFGLRITEVTSPERTLEAGTAA
jgi:flagellar motor switch protein FliN/FliY